MQEAFPILGQEFDVPPTFDQAVRDAVERLEAVSERFAVLSEGLAPEACEPGEARIIEQAAEELESLAERLDESYVAVQYDSHAWYRILELLERVSLRLESANGVLEQIRNRPQA